MPTEHSSQVSESMPPEMNRQGENTASECQSAPVAGIAPTSPASPLPPRRLVVINFLLFLIMAAVWILWFHTHVKQYFTQSVLIGGSLTFWAFFNLLHSLAKWLLGESLKTLPSRLLSSAAFTEIYVAGILLAAFAFGLTSSVYIEYEGLTERNTFTIDVDYLDESDPNNPQWKPFLQPLEVTSSSKIVGRPFFLQTQPLQLRFTVTEPRGFNSRMATLSCGSAIRLRVPKEFDPKEYCILRFVPGKGVHQGLPSVARKDDPHKLILRVDGKEYTHTKLIQQSIFAGAEAAELHWIIKQAEDLEAELLRYAMGLSNDSAEYKGLVDKWNTNPAYVSTPDFVGGQRVQAEIRRGKGDEQFLLKKYEVPMEAGIHTIFLENP